MRVVRTLLLMLLIGLGAASAAQAQCNFTGLSGIPNPTTVGTQVHFTWSAPSGAGCGPGPFVGYRFYVQRPGSPSFVAVPPDPGTNRTYNYTPNAAGSYAFKVTAAYTNTVGCTTCNFTEFPSNIVNVTVAACTFSLDPTAVSVGATGGAGTVAVTAPAGCAWTAMSNSTFVSITTVSSGTGNGVVTYSVSANTGAERSGTITVAAQTFTVLQAGVSPAPRRRRAVRQHP